MKLPNPSNIICASLLTGAYDVNRNETLNADDFEAIRVWYNSVGALRLSAVIFHNNFSAATEKQYTTDQIRFVRVDFDTTYNANIYRYFVYNDFFALHANEISNVFVTDITDVAVLQNPFETELFTQQKNALFCGDEPKKLDNEWMREHCTHLRNNISDFAAFEYTHRENALLNCGIIGGSLTIMRQLMAEITAIHRAYAPTNTTAYTLDMGAFNYVARTVFRQNLVHGSPVNTVFKGYETARQDVWFRHK